MPAGLSAATEAPALDGLADLAHPATTSIAETRRTSGPRIAASLDNPGNLPV
jgi:hypothetical protein